ncbi:hypothetical protein CGLO_11972 [Colletotrichum gloeosporioides Cg-14]|uniref:Uncharacterized protein n=1 Tax=Colletotrichum gloeosporioides (strain Cg-14) TaxID=1237896 RepID=T0K723_COLGC|nr:hypothetical protein CGLO_11972 [Colletotrichum gloeosporioides Cg-14]
MVCLILLHNQVILIIRKIFVLFVAHIEQVKKVVIFIRKFPVLFQRCISMALRHVFIDVFKDKIKQFV